MINSMRTDFDNLRDLLFIQKSYCQCELFGCRYLI